MQGCQGGPRMSENDIRIYTLSTKYHNNNVHICCEQCKDRFMRRDLNMSLGKEGEISCRKQIWPVYCALEDVNKRPKIALNITFAAYYFLKWLERLHTSCIMGYPVKISWKPGKISDFYAGCQSSAMSSTLPSVGSPRFFKFCCLKCWHSWRELPQLFGYIQFMTSGPH